MFSSNAAIGSFRSIDMATWTRQREAAISATQPAIVAPRACDISSTPSAAIPPHNSPTTTLSP
jgi:hypothetical protein